MAHRRKSWLVYPPNYTPGQHRYRTFHSKRKAFKQALKWGEGATVMDAVHIHPRARTPWQSSFSTGFWEIA